MTDRLERQAIYTAIFDAMLTDAMREVVERAVFDAMCKSELKRESELKDDSYTTSEGLANLTRKWVVADKRRRQLRKDRAIACVVASRRGAVLEPDDYLERTIGNWSCDLDDEKQKQAVECAERLDRDYQVAWRKAAGLRAMITRLCRDEIKREPDREANDLYDELCQKEQLA